jgi:hypothetical protein
MRLAFPWNQNQTKYYKKKATEPRSIALTETDIKTLNQILANWDTQVTKRSSIFIPEMQGYFTFENNKCNSLYIHIYIHIFTHTHTHIYTYIWCDHLNRHRKSIWQNPVFLYDENIPQIEKKRKFSVPSTKPVTTLYLMAKVRMLLCSDLEL